MNRSTSNNPVPARQRLATNLRLRRLLLGWSQETLAAEAGLDRSYIGDLEKAERNVSLDALEKLAKAFGTEIPELLADPEPAHLGERLIAQVRRAISNRHRIREEAALYA